MGKKTDDIILRGSLEIALAANDEREIERKRHYAFIWNRTKLISMSQNRMGRSPAMLRWHYPLSSVEHAEFAAIRKLNWLDCSKFTMVTFRLTKTGLLAFGKPCECCENVIRHVGFRKVWFSDDNREFKEMVLS
jgi:tRNA(Arg) A34 adenosine deaminase TadA